MLIMTVIIIIMIILKKIIHIQFISPKMAQNIIKMDVDIYGIVKLQLI